jgi:hypothetical protein
MAAATTAASLAARVAPHAAPGAARRGARVARRAPPSRPGARRSPSVVRAQDDGEGGPPASQGPGGFSGSRLIVPGMEGFDSSYGDVNPNARSIPTPSKPGGRGGPPGDPRLADKPGSFPGGYDAPPKPGSEKKEGEAFAPFRPPSEYLDAVDGDFLNEDDQMSFMRLRQRAGNWFQLAPLFPKLMRSGYLPDDIFDETGVEPREQSLWTTWTAARGSLVTDPRFPDEKLAYFDPEWNAETLSALQYLSSEKRAPFSEFVVDNEFNLEQTKELVKAVEIRAAHDSQAKGFGSGPGECLAFKMWRDVQEVQRYEGLGRVVELTEKGKKYATEQSTRERLDALVEMWRIDLAEGSDLMEGGLMGKANAAGNAKIQAVRLDADELAFKPVPMLGPLEKLQPAAVIAVEEIRPNGSFNVFKPVGSQQWVALPAWSALSAAKVPFAVLVGNTGSLRGAGDLSDREEPALLIVDKADQTPTPTSFYLIVRESSIQLAGGGGAEILDVYGGKDVMAMERDGTCTVIGRVVLAVRAPGMGRDDGMGVGASELMG